MTTTDDRAAQRRPALDCPSWCTDCDVDSDGSRTHWTPLHALPGHKPDRDYRSEVGRAEVWALSEDRTPRYSVHIEFTEEPVTAAELRATAEALLAFIDQVDDDARTETLIRDALAPMLRELSAVRHLPDDDPRRQAALEAKRHLLFLVEEHEAERLQR